MANTAGLYAPVRGRKNWIDSLMGGLDKSGAFKKRSGLLGEQEFALKEKQFGLKEDEFEYGQNKDRRGFLNEKLQGKKTELKDKKAELKEAKKIYMQKTAAAVGEAFARTEIIQKTYLDNIPAQIKAFREYAQTSKNAEVKAFFAAIADTMETGIKTQQGQPIQDVNALIKSVGRTRKFAKNSQFQEAKSEYFVAGELARKIGIYDKMPMSMLNFANMVGLKDAVAEDAVKKSFVTNAQTRIGKTNQITIAKVFPLMQTLAAKKKTGKFDDEKIKEQLKKLESTLINTGMSFEDVQGYKIKAGFDAVDFGEEKTLKRIEEEAAAKRKGAPLKPRLTRKEKSENAEITGYSRAKGKRKFEQERFITTPEVKKEQLLERIHRMDQNALTQEDNKLIDEVMKSGNLTREQAIEYIKINITSGNN